METEIKSIIPIITRDTSMSISYLCQRCAELLGMTGFDAVNEVGRKFCEGCGDNQDNLICVDSYKCDESIRMHNQRH